MNMKLRLITATAALALASTGCSAATSTTSTAENKLCLVDVASRKMIAELPKIWPVSGITFSPDGMRLAASGGYSGLNLWNTNEQSLANIACAIVNRNLSRGEWRDLVPAGTSYRRVCPAWPEWGE